MIFMPKWRMNCFYGFRFLCCEKIAIVALSVALGADIVHIYQKIGNQRPKGSSLNITVVDGEKSYLVGRNWICIGTAIQNESLIQIFNKAGPNLKCGNLYLCSISIFYNSSTNLDI